jgi:hypothetical protein
VVHSERRQILWQSLRERINSDPTSDKNLTEDELDQDLLFQILQQYMDLPGKPGNKIYKSSL